MTVVTAVLNVHDEGILAHASLLSIKGAVQEAETAGIVVEVIAVADCADRATLDCLAEHPNVRVLEGKRARSRALPAILGSPRRAANWCTFLDGDDLWGPSWIRKAHEAATQDSRATVWHPEVNLHFGPRAESCWFPHPDGETADGDWVILGVRNHWTSLSFAAREIYLKVPFRQIDLSIGFGYEDWSWNSEVIAQGYLHRLVPGTAHLVRVRDNSLVRRTAGLNSLMIPSTLLRSRIGWATQVGSLGIAAPPARSLRQRYGRTTGGIVIDGKRMLGGRCREASSAAT